MRSFRLRAITAATATIGLLGIGTAASAAESYEVQPGDTLSAIARSLDSVDTWQQLHAANPKLDDPNLIFPGQVLVLEGTGDEVAAETTTSSESSTATEPAPAAPATSTTPDGVWDRLAQCESSGDWHINTGNGYYGGLQFALSSWEWVGGQGYPHEASRDEQIRRAEILLERQGWNAWPACSSQLGLR